VLTGGFVVENRIDSCVVDLVIVVTACLVWNMTAWVNIVGLQTITDENLSPGKNLYSFLLGGYLPWESIAFDCVENVIEQFVGHLGVLLVTSETVTCFLKSLSWFDFVGFLVKSMVEQCVDSVACLAIYMVE
jgi:hypothetical protein